ncbi:MAG: ATP-grasp domain-containing protein [Nitrospinota bacterium]|nr:ATP-grasp domain-containing protein [Nitrospinota bacterium]
MSDHLPSEPADKSTDEPSGKPSSKLPDKPPDKPYLLIGSNIRFLAENAIRHGHDIVTVDYYGDWDTLKLAPNRSILRDGDGVMSMLSLVRLADGIDNRGVIYGPGFENDIVALRSLQRLGTVLGCDLKSARIARNPDSLMRAAATWGFHFPETLMEKSRPPESAQWLIKPLNSLGGGGISFYKENGPEPDGPYIFQKYVEGLPSSVSVVSNGSDAAVLGVTTQILGDPDFGASNFRFVGNINPHPFSDDIIDQVTEIAEALTLEFDMKGLWGYDFIYNGEVTLIEINPRPTAGMGLLGICSFSDLVGLHVDSLAHETSDKLIDFAPARRYTGQARVFAENELTFYGAEEWAAMGARDIPENGSIIRAGSPILTLTASAVSYAKTIETLKAQAAKLLQDLETPAAKAF